MRRTVQSMRTLALATFCILLLAAVGCVQKKRIYTEPARYAHGRTAQAPRPAAPEPLQPVNLPEPEPAASDPEPVQAEPKPDTPAESQDPFVGLASWIADDFHGLRTASGELYDKQALTAAHRSLPMDTRVEVTNLKNGRSIVVRINDRGPFKQERIIDVSRRAAEELGMIHAGLVRVRLRPLDTKAPEATASAATAAPHNTQTPPVSEKNPETGVSAAKAQGWYVQIGAFQDRDNAKSALARLFASGYADSRIDMTAPDGLYRVQAGSFVSRADAQAVLELLKPDYPAGFVLSSDSIQP